MNSNTTIHASQEEKEKLERECEQYLIKDDGLLFHIHLANGQPQTHNVILQLCVPRVLVPAIMKEMHDEPYSGHRGTEGTYGKLVHDTGGKECIVIQRSIASHVWCVPSARCHIDMETYRCYHHK